jgi:hypothetical protein
MDCRRERRQALRLQTPTASGRPWLVHARARPQSGFIVVWGPRPPIAILFTRLSGTPLGVGRYRISDRGNGADEVLVLVIRRTGFRRLSPYPSGLQGMAEGQVARRSVDVLDHAAPRGPRVLSRRSRMPPDLGGPPLRCRSFAVVSPGMSGQTTAGKRAPMLSKWPILNKLPEMIAPAKDSGSGESWSEARRGNSKVRGRSGGFGPFPIAPRSMRGQARTPADGLAASVGQDLLTPSSLSGRLSFTRNKGRPSSLTTR